MKKKDLKTLEYWENKYELEYTFIYIVPTSQKTCDGYKTAYYIGEIAGVKKLLDIYDCGNLYIDMGTEQKSIFLLNWDFEYMSGGIRFWSNGRKLKYEYGGRIFIN